MLYDVMLTKHPDTKRETLPVNMGCYQADSPGKVEKMFLVDHPGLRDRDDLKLEYRSQVSPKEQKAKAVDGEVKSVEETKAESQPVEPTTLIHFGLPENWLMMLTDNGYNTADQVIEAGEEGLTAINGIGKSTAKKILELVSAG